MQTILKQLYDGDIFPAEQYLPLMEEYKKARQKQYQHYEDYVMRLPFYIWLSVKAEFEQAFYQPCLNIVLGVGVYPAANNGNIFYVAVIVG